MADILPSQGLNTPVSSCNGQPLNCSWPASQPQADPDVAGLGVVFAFLISAGVTFLTVIVAYFNDTMPYAFLSRTDYIIIDRARALCRLKPRVQVDKRGKAVMGRVLRNFTLAMSDQLLVTGLAILIAGYSKRCSMTVYHFSLVISLAWFSSMVHLSTLAVLRDYFIEHPASRACRIAAMLLMLGLLFIAEFLTDVPSFQVDSARPIQCVFREFRLSNLFSDINNDIANSIQQFAILLLLILSYGKRLVMLYSLDRNMTIGGWLIQLSKARFGRSTVTFPMHYRTLVFLESSRHTQLGAFGRLRRLFSVGHYIHCKFQESFLWQLLWIVFGNIWGIAQIYGSRWVGVPWQGITGSDNVMGFGQLVSLLLLGLPLLAAVEGYGEFHKDTYGTKPENEEVPIENEQAEESTSGGSGSISDAEPTPSVRRVDTEIGRKHLAGAQAIPPWIHYDPYSEPTYEKILFAITFLYFSWVITIATIMGLYIEDNLPLYIINLSLTVLLPGFLGMSLIGWVMNFGQVLKGEI